MDQIHIQDLEIFANHGVYEEENRLGQKFLLSLTLYTDTRLAGQTDDLTKSIHYGEICHKAYRFLQHHTFKLIEKAAEELAKKLLLETEHLLQIEVELKKPWAPIGLPLQYAAVKICRQWHTAYLGIGSNMGDSRQILSSAIQQLEQTEGIKVEKTSPFISTKPYGVENQSDFLNGCIQLQCLHTPQELLALLLQIEQQAGRVRTSRWGPRTLDLDILLYDALIINEENLTIPHLDMHNRLFVLEPLSSIAPYAYHPVLKKNALQLAAELLQEENI